MRLIWCRPDILAITSLSIDGGKLSPSQPMIVLAPPCPGPPFFMAYIREEPLLSDMHQEYSIHVVKTEDNNVVIAVWIHR